jgi:hypothetical protein
MKQDYVQDFFVIAQGRNSAMQHAHSDSPRSQHEYEHSQEAHQHFEYESRIEGGEKILPPLREKKQAHRWLVWLVLAAVSPVVLAITIIINNISAYYYLYYSSNDLTHLYVTFSLFSVISVDTIIYLLFTRFPDRPARKGIIGRLFFAIITGCLTPVVCWMMIRGWNGAVGIILVLLITINLNVISYLTLCEKRRKPSKGRD